MLQLPLCRTGADLTRLDGQRVRVVGIYRRELVARKQGEPPTLFELGTVSPANNDSDQDDKRHSAGGGSRGPTSVGKAWAPGQPLMFIVARG